MQYHLNDRLWFDVDDPEPYTSGHFGIRAMMNRMRVDDFTVRCLPSAAATDGRP